jgi:hypothetical protein
VISLKGAERDSPRISNRGRRAFKRISPLPQMAIHIEVLVFSLANVVGSGGVGVTSQEQFKRLGEGSSSYSLKYNFERAYRR